jgi:hypothetical protein
VSGEGCCAQVKSNPFVSEMKQNGEDEI